MDTSLLYWRRRALRKQTVMIHTAECGRRKDTSEEPRPFLDTLVAAQARLATPYVKSAIPWRDGRASDEWFREQIVRRIHFDACCRKQAAVERLSQEIRRRLADPRNRRRRFRQPAGRFSGELPSKWWLVP